MFTEHLLTGDAKVTFNQAALDIGIPTVDNFNKVLVEMTEHAFPVYTFCKQKRYLCRHLVKPRSMKLLSFISRLQELNAYLKEFPPDTDNQETAALPVDKIMDIIYHSISTMWKNKMIEQGFNYADSTIKEMTDFFEIRVENMEPKEDKKNSSAASKKSKKSTKKTKREDSNSDVVESTEESTEAHRPIKKYCILHGKCGHSTENCKDLHAMLNKHTQIQKMNFRNYGWNSKELNTLIKKKFQKFIQNKKAEKQKKSSSIFKNCRFPTMKVKRASTA